MVSREPSKTEAGRVCAACGAFNPDGSSYCANCGQPVPGVDGAIVPAGAPDTNPEAPTIYVQYPPPQNQPPPQAPQPYYQAQPQIHYIQSPAPVVPVQQTVIVHGQRRGCFGRLFQGVGFVVVAIIVILILVAIF